MLSITPSEKDIDKFWSRVKIGEPNECWEWQAGKTGAGYGAIFIGGHQCLASRVSWTINFGPIKGELCVCHTCDNPICCNPSHCFLGTAKDNMQDRARKGRSAHNGFPGEKSHFAKLKEKDVIGIRKLIYSGWVLAEIARRYDISASTISNIKARRVWKYLE